MQDIETERLLIRPLTMDDLEPLFNLYRRPELMRYITGRPRTLAMTKSRLVDHITDHMSYGFGLCAAIEKSSGRMIGRCGIEPVPQHERVDGNLAWLFLREYWNMGLSTEFARAAIPVAFHELGLERVFATAHPANVASIRVMEKVGLVFVRSRSNSVMYELWRDQAPEQQARSSNESPDLHGPPPSA